MFSVTGHMHCQVTVQEKACSQEELLLRATLGYDFEKRGRPPEKQRILTEH